MPALSSNGLQLEVETFGQGEPILLIMGLGAQMLLWPDGFCEDLAARGFQVIRFDNRDIGKSTWLDHLPAPNLPMLMAQTAMGMKVAAPYTLSDMARDATGLLDAMGLDTAHVVGASMGGMIAQVLALHHPERVRSLTSIMSSSGRRRDSTPRPEAILALTATSPRTPAEVEDYFVNLDRVIGSPAWPTPEAESRALARRLHDRGLHSAGFLRHFAAILASGSRHRQLHQVTAPTLVIHGSADPLVPPSGGRSTAEVIPGARLMMVEGMGHNLPEPLWGRLGDAIESHCRSADQQPT